MRVVAVAVMASLMVAAGAHAATWTVTTTTDSDDGACTPSLCSLRDAVAAAGPGDVVSVPANTGHYIVSRGEIPIEAPITIQGAAAGSTIIDAVSNSRVFEVMPSVGASGTVTFDAVTLTGGMVTNNDGGAVLGDPGSGNEVFTAAALTDNSVTHSRDSSGLNGGGAIYDLGGDLTITGSTLSGNVVVANANSYGFNGGGAIWYRPSGGGLLSITSSTLRVNTSVTSGNTAGTNGGGAIYNVGGTVAIDRSTLADNTVIANGNQMPANSPGYDGGGAIFNDNDRSVTLTRSTVSGNTVWASGNSSGENGGGGILIQIGTLTIDKSTIAGNTAHVADDGQNDGGGGILAAFITEQMTITSSTISGNTADLADATGSDLGGGGIFDDGRQPSVYLNDTVTGNTVDVSNNNGSENDGGGIYFGGDAKLTNVTVVRNVSVHTGGAGLGGHHGHASIKGSIVAENTVGGDVSNCLLDVTSLGYNVIDDDNGDCVFSNRTDQNGADPRLGPLRDKGGPTKTMAPRPGSPAIDAIPSASCTDQGSPVAPVTLDQIGNHRVDNNDGHCDIGAFEAQSVPVPRNVSAPEIRGRAAAGATLTAAHGRWTYNPTSFVHRWLRCDTNGRHCRGIVSGSTRYRVGQADVGHRLRVSEVAVNSGGRGQARTSDPTAIVRA